MPLSPGTRLGPYEILAPIGAGGMGEVYKARDTRLDRTVAVKVSNERFSERFEREARAVASLNHSNICTLHDVGPDYLVMEYIEGSPLGGPLPLDQVLKYGAQICDALDAAHQKGITHRDLKPANILVTRTGIKLLDFGLAKIAQATGPAGEAMATMALTGKNEIVGTLYYMSPEQLQAQGTGKEVDARSDIFSFGVVLYEMVTGRRAFDGSSPASVVAAILERPAPSLTDVAPVALDRVLQACLVKDPGERWQSVRDLKRELVWIAAASGEAARVSRPAGRRSWLPWIAAGVLALGLTGALWSLWRVRTTPQRGIVQMDLDAFPDEVLDPVISPDGSRVVFVSKGAKGRRLAMRRMDQSRITVLDDTEGARFPFFSPDGGSVGFFASEAVMAEGGKLKKLSLESGVVAVLADAEYPGGGTWGEDDVIAASLNQWATGIVSRISAAGGAAQALTVREQNSQPEGPQFLPGGKGLLFTRKRYVAGFFFDVCVAVPGGPAAKVLVPNASGAHYLDSGHLMFYRKGKIFAARFDLDRLQLLGEAVSMVEEVADQEGIAQFSLSRTGDLVYRRGQAPQRMVVGIDASGKQTRWIASPGGYLTPRVSPDGTRFAVMDESSGNGRILIHDMVQGTTSRLTLDERPQALPAWTPDGTRVVYVSEDKLLSVRVDGTGQPEILASAPAPARISFSRDGKLAAGDAFSSSVGTGDRDIWVAPVDFIGGSPRFGKTVALAGGAGNQEYPVFSPDGRWVAYMSNETGVYQVYVVSISADGRPAGGKWQVSTVSGYNPAWPAAGGQLSFEGGSSSVVVVSYATKGDRFLAGPPRPWAPVKLSYYSNVMSDTTPDGKQVIAIVDGDSERPETHVRVILNFGDEVRRRLAGGTK
jgi:Tol biopolymer transport system component/predicted Ser/Thr protein kinase